MGSILTLSMAVASVWVVIVPVANMHSSPSGEADVVSQALYGAPVATVGTESGWTRVRTSDSYEGWVLAAELLEVGEDGYPSGERALFVDSIFANLYAEPDVTRHRPLLTVPYDTRLEVAAEPEEDDGRWIEVRLPDDRRAWIQRGDARFGTGELSVNETVELSKRFIGLPYLWGGTSTFGYDCSAFMQMLCRRRGVAIPRDSGPQAHWEGMIAIEKSELRPGDLVYFGELEAKITHTGMYIGGGEFIHATAYRKPAIQISRLDDPHWSELLVACRRLGGTGK